jgi:hypothetical protein
MAATVTRERVTWITLPAGTPSDRGRVSVLVSPMIEGMGRANLSDLQRFRSWPALAAGLQFALWIDGQNVATLKQTPMHGLEPSDQLWQKVFSGDLEVDLLDLTKTRNDAASKGSRLPIAPPTTDAAAVIKGRYAAEIHQPAAEPAAKAAAPKSAAPLKPAAFNPPGLTTPPKPVVPQWSDYIRIFHPPHTDTQPVAGTGLKTEAVTTPEAQSDQDPLHMLRAFHNRPPLPIYPHVLRDHREIPKDVGGEPISRSAAVPSEIKAQVHTEARDQAASPHGLMRIPLSTDKREHDVVVPRRSRPAGELTLNSTQLAPPDTVVLAPQGDDRLGGGAMGFKLREADQVTLSAKDKTWTLERLQVQVHLADDQAILYARHFRPAGCELHAFAFRLPPDPPVGFSVTLRTLEKQEVKVTAVGFSDTLDATVGKVYRWDGHAWTGEPENRQDFHARVASLRAYPDLLRRLGLILDFELPTAAMATLGATGRLRLMPLGAAHDFDVVPFTEYQRSSDPWSLLPRPERSDTPYDRGFLTNTEGRHRFKIVQLDTDTAAIKLGAAEEPAETVMDQAPVAAVSLTLQGDPQITKGLPTLRHHGIALCDTTIESDTTMALQRAQSLTQHLCDLAQHLDKTAQQPAGATLKPGDPKPPPEIVLHAEDLVQGFRVDVQRHEIAGGDHECWRSLCKRCGSYYWAGAALDGPACWTHDDEGLIAPTADEVADPGSPNRALRLSQALFRWDGWSLTAQRPGRAFDETAPRLSGSVDPNTSAAVRAQFKPKCKSLERLRLGAKYSFRLRLVDLAGNSLSLEDANRIALGLDDLRVFNSGCFERPETIEAPTLVPCSMPGPGEGNDQWVIRSTESQTASRRSWLLLPPIASPSFVELHGVLDELGDTESWNLLQKHNDLPPTWNPELRGYDSDWVATYFNPEKGLPYLPDPLCQAVAFRHEAAGIAVASLPLGDRSSFRTGYPRRISQRTVSLAASHSAEVRPTREGMEFRLPPGRIAQIEMSSCPPEDALPLLGLLNWCDCAHDPLCIEVPPMPPSPMPSAAVATLHGACCAGEVCLVTPNRTLKLVHAVERPLLPPGRSAPGFVTDRLYRFDNPVHVQPLADESTTGGTKTGVGFTLDGQVWIDTPSTGKLDFRMMWKEPVDDPQAADFYDIDGSAPGFQVNVPLTAKDLTLFPASPASHPCGPAPCLSVDPFPFMGTVRFDDGRHRRVQLQYEATSRFTDYFDRPQDGTTERFRIPSEAVEIHIPARVPPAAPGFYYAVPTFSFEHEKKKHEVTARRLGGLRLYFQRGWFSSGADEMLAVVFAQSSTASLPSPLDQLVSAWGEDPLWEPTGRRLTERPLLSDVSGIERPVPSLVTPLRYELPEDEDKPDPNKPLIDVELALATYTPRLDPAKNLLFVDLDLRVPSYFPFVRLGLARYQRYALAGQELSAIVPAVFCQLMPDISVTATPRRRGCWEVSVVAPSGASPIVSPSKIGPQRIFRVVKVDHGNDPDRLRRGAWPLGSAVELKEIVTGDDGMCRWSGVIETGRMGCGERIYVMEEQSWTGEAAPAVRLVGCIPVAL